MGSVLHRDFTLKSMITPAVLDAQMNLSLFHTTMSVPGCTFFVSFWRHATILPQRNSFLHDLITRVFLRSIQYGIVVLGFFDAFVHAHHKHRQDSENSGNFGDCMKGRIRFYDGHHSCLRPRVPGNVSCTTLTWCPAPHFRLPKPKARYPYLPNARSITRERGNDYRGWAIYTDGGTRV